MPRRRLRCAGPTCPAARDRATGLHARHPSVLSCRPAARPPRATRRSLAPRHALSQAPVDQFALEGRRGFLSRYLEVLPGAIRFAGPAVELAERRVEQMIRSQGRVESGLVERTNARPRAFDLGDDNRPVEEVYR